MEGKHLTRIQVTKDTKDQLRFLARLGTNYDQRIRNLLAIYEEYENERRI